MTIQSPAFVARECELARLDELLARALAGQLALCFVTGEAGSGKTALVTEFARRAEQSHNDLVFAIGECNAQTGIGDPYLPFREILSLLTGDVERKLAEGAITEENGRRLHAFLRSSGKAVLDYGPALVEIFVPGSELLARVGAKVAKRLGWTDRLNELMRQRRGAAAAQAAGLDQSHIFEQYANVLNNLAKDRPLILVLDDLHWVDPASASLLFHLCRRISEIRMLIIGTFRPAEVAVGRSGDRHPLDPVLNDVKRQFGDVRVDLDTAGGSEGRRVVDELVDQVPNQLSEEFRQRLYLHTQGHPLFTIELLRSLQESGDLGQDEEGRWVVGREVEWHVLPARVEGVIEERIARLREEPRRVLTAASVEGENFTAEVVARALRLDERETVRQLSGELEKQHQLVGARGVRRLNGQRLSLYQFRHNLFQKYLYRSLDEVERSYLHEDVGNVLEELFFDQAEEVATQLARHFTEAGREEKALCYLLQAGEKARAAYANEEAAQHFQSAREMLEALPSTGSDEDWRPKVSARLHESLGDVRAHTGKHEEARAAYESALDAVPADDPVWRSRLQRKLGDSWQAQHQGERAIDLYSAAENELGVGARPAEPSPEWWHERIEIQLGRAWVLYFAGGDAEITALADETRPMVERHGTAAQRAKFLQRQVLISFRRERYALSEDTLELSRAAFAAGQESGGPTEICEGQFAVGFTQLWRGNLDEARRELEAVLEQADRIGSTFHRILCLTYLAIVCRFRGQVEEAGPYISRCLAEATMADVKTYIATAEANLAWVAWRANGLAEAERRGKVAVEIWRKAPIAYPFRWTALWPLIGATLADDRVGEAVDYARLLLEPTQQRLPEVLSEELKAALAAQDRGEIEPARSCLDQAMHLAEQAGYL